MLLRAVATAAALICGTGASADQIVSAGYEGPTDRYPHTVLGDPIEYDTLAVTVSDGRILRAQYEATIVFEDTAPRLADVTGDGLAEVVVVESHQSQGARLVIWGLAEGQLRHIARTPFIGTRFRWLAPVGVADLDGDGHIEIAYIDRPHLAKTLRIWRYTTEDFTEIATQPGLTNHKIGEDFITGGVRVCGEQPELIVVDAQWRSIIAARLTPAGVTTEVIAPFDGTGSVNRVLACG